MTNSDGDIGGTPVFDSTRQNHEEPPEVFVATPDGTLDAAPDGTYPATMDTPYAGAPGGTDTDRSTTDVAKEQASRVADSALDAGKDVAGVAMDEAHAVAHETKQQARQLYHQTQDELREQAALQQQRVADGLRSIGDELQQMARSSEQQGVASDLVGQAADRTQSVARWLDARDPGSLLSEVKSYARRNPGTFIAVAALTGVVAGRLTRALASGGDDGDDGATSAGGPR